MYMKATNFNVFITILYTITWITRVQSFWEFAVTTDEEIKFYSHDWTLIRSAAHQFHDLAGISFDEIKDVVYFSDKENKLANIFSLKIYENDHFNYRIKELVKKQLDEEVEGLAYDPATSVLYWTDTRLRQIHRWDLTRQGTKGPEVWKTFATEVPRGVAVDICRQRVYWTNKGSSNPGIQYAGVNETEHHILIDEDLKSPLAIVIDPFEERIYWSDYVYGSSYKIESADLHGKNRIQHLYEPSRHPVGLAIDAENIYFADASSKEIVQVNKKTNAKKVVAKMDSHIPRGIIVRNTFLYRDHVTPKCEAAFKVVKEKIEKEKAENTEIISEYCVNDGIEVQEDGNRRCDCPLGFTGIRCEIDLCKNYCLNGGTCIPFKNATFQCNHCDLGFKGERCEIDICKDTCLNGGICDLKDGQPTCSCPLGFYGDKCDQKRPKWDIVCIELCQDAEMDVELKPICQRCSNSDATTSIPDTHFIEPLPESHPQQCIESAYNKSLVFTSLSVMGSLLLLSLIIFTIYKIHKPTRPRVKKTYVVQRNIQGNAAHGRAPSTEQCEIIIENCCNMNICETPCFDPKVLQQNCDSPINISCKEDKKQLLDNMEGELF